MKPFKPFLVALSVLVLQACATVPAAPPPVAVVDISGKTCVGEPSLAAAISLTPIKKNAYFAVSTQVDSAKPCLTAGGESGNYVVYALPEHGDNHTLTVGGVQEVLRTFAPSVSLLDAEGKVTRTFTDDRYAVLGNILGIQFRPTAAEKYVLVQSNPHMVGKSVNTFETRINYTQGYAATPYAGYSYQTAHGTEGKHERVFSHEGYVSVTIQAIAGKIGLPDEK